MKKLILILLLSLTACGQYQSETNPLHIPNDQIIWQGNVQDDSSLFSAFNKTMLCLDNLDAARHGGHPYVIEVSSLFTCSAIPNVLGCVVENTIYILKNDLELFEHETIHWATGLSNRMHDSIYFTQCSAL